jgi:hypothetical protein
LSYINPNFKLYPFAVDIFPLRHLITLSATFKASGPLTLITEIAPVPGTVAGAHIVSSFFIYIISVLAATKIAIIFVQIDEIFLSLYDLTRE